MLHTVIDALRRGQGQEALAAARAAVEADPGNAEAHHLLGLAERGAGDLAAARASLDRALELAPDRAVYHLSRAGLALADRDADAARRELGAAVQLDPNQLSAYISLADLALVRRDLAEAEAQLRLAQRVDPDHPQVLILDGHLALARGDHERAISRFTVAVKRAPEDAHAQSSLGLAYLAAGNYAFAEQAVRNALARQPDSVAFRRALAEALGRQGRLGDAAVELATLVAQRPDDLPLRQAQGELESLRGEADAAQAAFVAVLERLPGYPRAVQGALNTFVARGDFDGARALFEAQLQRAPQSEALWQARFALEREAAAGLAVLERWRAALPESVTVAELLAQLHEGRGESEQAEALADQVLAKAPARVAAQLSKARAELARDPGAAIIRLEALAQSPDTGAQRAAYGWLGQACDRAGRPAEAVQHLLQLQVRSAELRRYELPGLPEPEFDDAAATLAAEGVPEAQADAPVFLWGPPGSGVERVAALLRGQRERPFLDDRFTPRARLDGFQDHVPPHAALPDQRAEHARTFAEVWRRGRQALGAGSDAVIDWLGHWDARYSLALALGLPGAKLLVALRDPRDLLLNWLAFGSPVRARIETPEQAAEDLANMLGQLLWTEREGLITVQRVSAPTPLPELAHALQRTLGLAAAPDVRLAAALTQGTAGRAGAFGDGHWRDYAQVLAPAFARLAPLAHELGYRD